MRPDLPPGLVTFGRRFAARPLPPGIEDLPVGSRRCWNCRRILRVIEPCSICSAPFRPRLLALAQAQHAPRRELMYDPFAERVLPGLRERFERIASRAGGLAGLMQVDPRTVRRAAAFLVLLLASMAAVTYRVEKNARLGTLETSSAAHAKQMKLLTRTTTAVPRVAPVGGAHVAVTESWIAPIGRRQYESLLSDRVRVYPTRSYRQYLRLTQSHPNLIQRVVQERGLSRQPLEHLGHGVYAIDLRDAFPRPAFYRIETPHGTARIRVH